MKYMHTYYIRAFHILTELPHAILSLISDKPSTFNNIELIMSSLVTLLFCTAFIENELGARI